MGVSSREGCLLWSDAKDASRQSSFGWANLPFRIIFEDLTLVINCSVFFLVLFREWFDSLCLLAYPRLREQLAEKLGSFSCIEQMKGFSGGPPIKIRKSAWTILDVRISCR